MSKLKRHFPFVLGGILALIAVGIAALPTSVKGKSCGSILSSHDLDSCSDQRTELLIAIAIIVIIAVVIIGTYVVFLLVERREERHATRNAIAPAPANDGATPMQSFLVTSVTDRVHSLVALHPEIAVVALVGSRARGTASDTSDVDLIVLAPNPAPLLSSTDWYPVFGPDAVLVRSEQFGAITERRLKLSTGLEIDVGIGALEWLGTDPMDPGTARVLTDGAVPIYDPQLLLHNALQSVRRNN